MGKIKEYNYWLEFNASKLSQDAMFGLSDQLEKLIKTKKFKVTGAGTALQSMTRDISFAGKEKITTAFKNKIIALGKKNKVKITINDNVC